jgi:hypothetical protein
VPCIDTTGLRKYILFLLLYLFIKRDVKTVVIIDKYLCY